MSLKNKDNDYKILISPSYIKSYLEDKTGIKSLSVRNRETKIREIRYVGFKIAKELCFDVSLSEIAEAYSMTHANVINGIKQFDDLFNQKSFSYNKKLYKQSLVFLRNMSDKANKKGIQKLEEAIELKNYYRAKFIVMMDKYHEVINIQNTKILNLSKRDIFKEMASLSNEDFYELEIKINSFLDLKRIKTNKF